MGDAKWDILFESGKYSFANLSRYFLLIIGSMFSFITIVFPDWYRSVHGLRATAPNGWEKLFSLIFNNNAYIALTTETIEVRLEDQNEIKD